MKVVAKVDVATSRDTSGPTLLMSRHRLLRRKKAVKKRSCSPLPQSHRGGTQLSVSSLVDFFAYDVGADDVNVVAKVDVATSRDTSGAKLLLTQDSRGPRAQGPIAELPAAEGRPLRPR